MRAVSISPISRRRSGINVTPMIDVVMCLIVFYLMVGQLALERRAQITIPETETGADPSERTDPIVVSIDSDGVVSLGASEMDPARLRGELEGRLARNPDAPVRVRADERAGFGSVRPVLRAIEDVGVSRVEFVTLKPLGGAPGAQGGG